MILQIKRIKTSVRVFLLARHYKSPDLKALSENYSQFSFLIKIFVKKSISLQTCLLNSSCKILNIKINFFYLSSF
ncbi:hypothetical protein BpHYR1_037234 [Brachionus plicatilis]|uniref:Uncharacterized protein n=1 Tax=Brachionus plicatilis TaxID=10195 RepID=A0A3M7PSI7_BRAPC|nr:hypothetical protein BpHYR1_037234 [Brachionus plicatilis]